MGSSRKRAFPAPDLYTIVGDLIDHPDKNALIESWEIVENGPRDGDAVFVIVCRRSWLSGLAASVETSAPRLSEELRKLL